MNVLPLRSGDIDQEKRSSEQSCELEKKEQLRNLIKQNSFDVFFQPIVCLRDEIVFGHEGLCRLTQENPFGNIENLFEQARAYGEICSLDMLCRENSVRLASSRRVTDGDTRLFLNVCPTSLQQRGHRLGETEKIVKAHGLGIGDVVLEITEQEAVSNYPLFLRAIKHYRKSGFKIAIDDFGAGYGGLKMLSLVAPDYVKIDRHFFRDMDSAHINYSLIDSIATVCHRLGIEVIAEGIETENDVKICREFGIDKLQGYFFGRPSPQPLKKKNISFPLQDLGHINSNEQYDEPICIGDIMEPSLPVMASERVLHVLDRFSEDPQLYCIPVLSGEKVCGMINRHRFMEKHMVGRHGYGMDLNYYKRVADIVDDDFFQVPHCRPIEEVAKKINARKNMTMYDDICVTRSGKFIGTVGVGAILNAVTNKSILYAKGANPLTGLPGNEFIQREIVKMLSQSIHFDISYIDIDSFKPYNDSHGFALGDEVIKQVGRIVADTAKKFRINGVGFAGHIGGDDFILITRPRQSIRACEYVNECFAGLLPGFHAAESIDRGSYTGLDRDGRRTEFKLLSLSIGIVSTEVHHITSAAEISSIASDLKKRAKAIPGPAIIRDRRTNSTWYA